MNIKIESGAKVQITDKPIVNVFGDVNIGEKREHADYDVEAAVYEEVKKGDNEQSELQKNDLNFDSPRIVLEAMLLKEWFDSVCSDKTRYNKNWRNRLVSDFMSSEYGAYIAKLWGHKDKIQTIKAKFTGALAEAGVLKGSNLAIARAYLGINKNTRDAEEKKVASTFANYMGQGKKEPYCDWIRGYVDIKS